MSLDFRDYDRLEHVLELIGHIGRRLQGMTAERFLDNIDEIDLTAFRLSVIGEAVRKLGEPVKQRHADIDWNRIYAMRNVIVHDYQNIKAERVWDAAQFDLAPLAAVCEDELGQS